MKWEQLTLLVPEGTREAVLEMITSAGYPNVAIYTNEDGTIFRKASSGENHNHRSEHAL